VPRCSRVATLANCKVIAAKRALAIVASHAALPSTRRMMIKRLRGGNLFSLWHSGSHLVTFSARYFLMFRMIKADSERLGRLGCPGITAQLMTRSARRNITPSRLCSGCVASETSNVRVESRWDRQRHAGARRPVTGGAIDPAHIQVPRMIELHREAFQAGKRFQRCRFRVGMADRADRTSGI
jgi:hypothetical protein